MKKKYLMGLTIILLFNMIITFPVLAKVVERNYSNKNLIMEDEVIKSEVNDSNIVTVEQIIVEVEENKTVEIDKNIQPIYKNKSKEDVVDGLNKIVSNSMLTMTINSNIVFKNGVGLIDIKNESNVNNLKVEIHLKESGLLVYRSRIIEVGGSVNEDQLNILLDKGKYPAIATFKSIGSSANEVLGEGKLEILLTVED